MLEDSINDWKKVWEKFINNESVDTSVEANDCTNCGRCEDQFPASL